MKIEDLDLTPHLGRGWDRERAILIAWYQRVRRVLPTHPYTMLNGFHIPHPPFYYLMIDQLIEEGPCSHPPDPARCPLVRNFRMLRARLGFFPGVKLCPIDQIPT